VILAALLLKTGNNAAKITGFMPYPQVATRGYLGLAT